MRGLKVQVAKVPIPVSYGPAFEGERVRGEDIYLEMGGGKTVAVEWTTSKRMEEVEDGRVEVIGPDVSDVPPGTRLHFAMVAEVAGRNFQEDFEPILERQNHHLINQAQGDHAHRPEGYRLDHGSRNRRWRRASSLTDIGKIIHAKYHQDFGAIFDKVQIKIYTEEAKVREILEQARASYEHRDARVENMTDENDGYLLLLHPLPVLCAEPRLRRSRPERTGLCGAYNWLDCQASYEINPDGPEPADPEGGGPRRSGTASSRAATISSTRRPGRRSRT